ncbi:MAG: hypothetical protein OQK78_09930 [Gammaproteobacteria bacterium]|nr:hypothetical protein [Gammaproteobacteria bacterium]
MFHHLAKIVITLSIIGIASCGGGDSDSSSDPSISTIPAGFYNSINEFTQYEGVVVETDECHLVDAFSIDGEWINYQYIDGTSYLVEIPGSTEPGSYTLDVVVYDICSSSGSTLSTVPLNFELQQAITVENPELYLDERLNDAIQLVDEMLASETDAGLIAYLTQLRTNLTSQLAGLPTLGASSIENNALMLLNNEPDLSSLPIGFSVSDIYTCEGTRTPGEQVLTQCRFNWLVMSVAGFAISATTGNVLGAYVSAASFIYHLKKFRAETTDNDIWTDVKTEFQDESGATYLENEYDSLLPDGVTLASDNSMIFTENFEQSIKVKITRSVKAADISIIQGIKDAVAKVASYLPEPLPTQIAALSYEDKVEYVADTFTYLISDYSISDDRLEISKLIRIGDEIFITISPKSNDLFIDSEAASFSLLIHDHNNNEYSFSTLTYSHQAPYSTELSISSVSDIEISDERLEVTVTSVGDTINISFAPKVDAVILGDFPFTFSLSDPDHNKQVFNSTWSVDIPLPQANNMDFWYDFSGIGLIHGTVDSYPLPSKESISGGLLINTSFAETVEIVTPPQYLQAFDGENYLNVWTGDGIQNSEVTLNIDPYSFVTHLPDGGAMTDSLQYRVRNQTGVSAIKTIRFGSKYANSDQHNTLDLSSSLPPITSYAELETLTVPLSTTTGLVNPRYSVYLEISPQYVVWSIAYDPYLSGDYIVRLVVKDSVTGEILSGKAIPEEIRVDLKHDITGYYIDVISDGAGGAWESSLLGNGPEVYIGDPSWIIVTADDLMLPIRATVSQSWYNQCKYPTDLWEFYVGFSSGLYVEYCLN